MSSTGRARRDGARSRVALVAGLAVGGCLTWNVSNVGAVADPLSHRYGTSLAVIGLLTTTLFVSHLVAQLPAGMASDRVGARFVASRCLWSSSCSAVSTTEVTIPGRQTTPPLVQTAPPPVSRAMSRIAKASFAAPASASLRLSIGVEPACAAWPRQVIR